MSGAVFHVGVALGFADADPLAAGWPDAPGEGDVPVDDPGVPGGAVLPADVPGAGVPGAVVMDGDALASPFAPVLVFAPASPPHAGSTPSAQRRAAAPHR